MAKRMLIDATHAEETRVVVLNGTRLEEFDVETSTKKQLKGNIYLAKVTRVEPSLQAAFIEYGGNRHGFLAFNEIHPDYYRIPVSDREALAAEAAPEIDDRSAHGDDQARAYDHGDENGHDHHDHDHDHDHHDHHHDAENGNGHAHDGDPANGEDDGVERLETIGGDAMEEVAPRRPRSLRNYKIQEVIARRQIMLVQVVKEERGGKGAALTTYLSLAGRYCVLMPNTPRGGGVSRKIASATDRKRLKTMLDDFDIPEGMAVIVRTAGMERPRPEIKRDYEYLLRLWDEIRENTLQASAPALIHEEGSLVKRAIRDLYQRDIDEILVDGEEGYKAAKSFMKMIVPSHAKRVQPYRDPAIPLMHRYQVESQLDAIYNPTVQLKSGGYIVINPTEALVSIDVNSGRSTKERHIEETAYKTNMEAAEEVARQLRLRDLAGLIVIDFIDMEENRNNAAVERKLKEAMKSDRARIQIGRISPFGLLELSRQRLRPSLIEASTEKCPHCNGSGSIRSTENSALHVLRAIEEEGIRGKSAEISVTMPTTIALYLLNQKREALASIEQRYRFHVLIGRDETLIPPEHRIERIRARAPGEELVFAPLPLPAPEPEDIEDEVEELDETEVEARDREPAETSEDGENGRRRSRRRRRRRGRREDETGAPLEADGEEARGEDQEGDEPNADEQTGDEDDESEAAGGSDEARNGELDADGQRRRRRGKRGGRRRRGRREDGETGPQAEGAEDVPDGEQPAYAADEQPAYEQPAYEQPANAQQPAPAMTEAAVTEAAEPAAAETAPEKPKRSRRKKADAAPPEAVPAAEVVAEAPAEKPKRAPRRRKVEPAPEAASEPAATVAAPAPVAPPAPTAPVPAPIEPEPAAPAETAEEAAPRQVEGLDLVVVDQPTDNPKKGWWRRLVK